MSNRFNAADLARRLSGHAEAVCSHYLSNGRKAGRYWLVGDVMNTAGQSLHVRLTGPSYGPGAAGKWSDEATGEHGDLLDLIRINRNLQHFPSLRDEVLCFLSEPAHLTRPVREKARSNSREAARRLFAMATPIEGTLAETYLASRGLTLPVPSAALRFHSACFYRPDAHSILQRWPALLAAVTDDHGELTGLLRTYLARDGSGKAPLDSPRLAMGDLNGFAVRFAIADEALVLGEGLETVLSVQQALPGLPAAAALTANHLRAFAFPPGLKRLYLATDNDPAGLGARDVLRERATATKVAMTTLLAASDDWNAVLKTVGLTSMRAALLQQLSDTDRARAMA
jgi:phage/plasmid primase-like uncharacterized protein